MKLYQWRIERTKPISNACPGKKRHEKGHRGARRRRRSGSIKCRQPGGGDREEEAKKGRCVPAKSLSMAMKCLVGGVGLVNAIGCFTPPTDPLKAHEFRTKSSEIEREKYPRIQVIWRR
ncbi:hypothetical protein BU24DRAFT_283471 [Aaosphaeria arxii CBS 175.79]|uniref:Uncharacterized protein n=1 Tax=Aaosphaeria arxii CBS 175.79 TaxID=1450172 RepID=A0A6A5XFC1_9PLEO|nr:uncharacterized protein BU24DRAFT_283471 [Aaosphaeria arxii CBS 175.79]KAF2011546.1 hypothetical protein BU24DRAFT_283471 [Aaosphaeria arxii CBS 175.79]